MRHLFFLAAALLVGLVPSTAPAQVYGDTNSLVDSWYRTYLGRAPDPAMAGWVTQLNQGTPADAILAQILGSPEYYGRAGSTPQGYVAHLYGDVLRRPPTPAELNYWVGRMYTTDRPGIADAVLTQNPGVWVGSTTVVTPPPVVVAPPPVVVTPPAVIPPHAWERDRHGDWAQHHDIHDYHRPINNFHREEPHDHHR